MAAAPDRLLPTIAWTVGASLGAALLAMLLAPYAGRAGAALLCAVVIAVIGTFRGLAPALVAALVEFLAFGYLIGERRLPGEFELARHLPQLALFILVALIAGGTASKLRVERRRSARRDAQLAALVAAGRALAGARDAAAIVAAVREAGFAGDIRLFAIDGGGLREVAPLPDDDAGRAAEAAEVAWLTDCQMHRMAGVTAVPLGLGGGARGVLVVSAALPVSPPVLEALAQMIGLAASGAATAQPPPAPSAGSASARAT